MAERFQSSSICCHSLGYNNAPSTAPLDRSTALGCRLCSGDSTASLGLSPSLSLAVRGETHLLPRAPSSGMEWQWDGMAVGWMAAGQAPLRVTKAGSEPGILFGESSHPRDTQQDTQQDTQPAQPTERPTGHPSCHLTLDFQPGLNSLLGRAATLSQEKETDGSGCVKAMASSLRGRGKPRSFSLPPSMDLGAQFPIPASTATAPAQPHQPGPAPCQRQQLSDKDQLQPYWWLGWFPSQSREQTTRPTRRS